MPIRMEAYDYRGHTIIVLPSGRAMVFSAATDPRNGHRECLHEAISLAGAREWIFAKLHPQLSKQEIREHLRSYTAPMRKPPAMGVR